jgi:hypothetical protein
MLPIVGLRGFVMMTFFISGVLFMGLATIALTVVRHMTDVGDLSL